MLFPCLQAGLVSSFRLNHAGEGAVFPATRPGFPVLPNNGSKVKKAATGSRPETSFVVSPVETGKLKQRGDSRRVEMRQLTAINDKLRAAVEEYEDGMIEGYSEQEIANINKFMDHLVESTKTLVVDVYIAVELRGRITEVKDEHCLIPETPEELAGPQEA